MEEASTTGLLRSLREGDLSAFRALYRRIAPSLLVWASIRIPKAIHHRFDPDDLLQETWCRALDAWRSFDPRKGRFRSWVFGIATKTLAGELRRIHRRGLDRLETPEALPEEVSSVSQRVSRMEEVRLLLERVERLDRQSREILLFRGLEGLPYRELSERVGLSVAACEMRWRRLRKQLQGEMLPGELFES